ncbi:CBS domain-containing protein [Streptomyces sp. NA02950]|uniref:CBS domain-containing protein n=1 Tax=Streptomyces sp. NA02950 TaxID=2742137 RepID=UPI0015903FA6|nr:CBS domain-containing protein [Streptomyces sp. NA02950]QKV90611.1 CBS domain-containing protein [Streptomyces sp. NA02950]
MADSRVRDVMTQDVAAVRLHTPYKEIVRILEERRFSALPVLDDEGGLAGVVSEADLLDKAPGARPTGLLGLRRGSRKKARKARGLTARALMTAPAVTVPAEANVAEAARTMARRGLKRLPVVDDRERLVGIVSRRDLLRRYLRSDDEIREEILRDVFMRVLWADPAHFTIDVSDGVVVLSGALEQRSAVPVAVRLTRGVDGVVDVVDKLTYRMDDTQGRPTFRSAG